MGQEADLHNEWGSKEVRRVGKERAGQVVGEERRGLDETAEGEGRRRVVPEHFLCLQVRGDESPVTCQDLDHER